MLCTRYQFLARSAFSTVAQLAMVGFLGLPERAAAATRIDESSLPIHALANAPSPWLWGVLNIVGLGMIVAIAWRSRSRELKRTRQLLETEQTHARKIRADRERLRLAMELARMETWDWDLATDEVKASPGLAAMFGGPEILLLKEEADYRAFIHPDDRPRLEESIRDAIKGRGSFHHEFRVNWQDGSEHWIEGRGEVQYDDSGQAESLLGISMNVTDRHQQESGRSEMQERFREIQRLESLAVLAGGIAHDFNNLLTSILANVDLVQNELPEESEHREMLADAVQASQRASDLCHQMLAYSGRGRFLVRPVNLNEIIRDNAPVLESAADKHCALKLDLCPRLSTVMADGDQLLQLMLNLVVNASEAMPDGGGQIIMRTSMLPSAEAGEIQSELHHPLLPRDHVALLVEDTGCGIAETEVSKIFEPFHTTKFTGRGLGLSAVQGIVRGHQGGIVVRSTPGLGTTFTVLIPISESPTLGDPGAPVPQGDSKSGNTILVVDDEDHIRQTTERILRHHGFTVVTASDGNEGVARFWELESELSLVLLDLAMPGMDGVESFKMMKRLNREIPIVLMSGFTRQESLERFGGDGLAGFVKKPFDPAALMQPINEALK